MTLDNSKWPNGIKEDAEGSAVFYPLGTNKTNITDVNWPEGHKLISPFIYDENDKLIDFIDTKAIVVTGSDTTTTIPYNHIEADFSSILEGSLNIDAPNASTKVVKWNRYPTDLLPTNYTHVEYLESTGTQVIDVPVTIDCERSIIMWEGNLLNQTENHHSWGISVQTSEGYMKTGLRVQGQNAEGKYYLHFMKPSTAWDFFSLGYYKKGEIHKITVDYAAGKIYIDGEAKGSFTPQNYKFVGDCGLFAHRWNPSTADGSLHTDYWRGRASHFSISSNGQNERHFIPALDETGAPCMFDVVTRTPFYNVGSGDFVTPPMGTTTYGMRRVLPDWGKLTPNGLRRLYHAPAGYKGDTYDYAIENGYKQIVEPEMPEDGYWRSEWTETDTQIICNWIETEAPTEENT